MSSKRQSIVDALQTALTNVTAVSGRVFCRRTSPLLPSQLPALVYSDNEATTEMEIIGIRTHRLSVEITAITTTKTSASQSRTLTADICTAIFADQTLGGIAESIELNSHNIMLEQDAEMLAAAHVTITIIYRTAVGAV